jgi:hypothetical protein
MPVLFWYGLKMYVERRAITLRATVITVTVVLLGVALMGVIAYGVGGSQGLGLLVINRLWMSGDVYIYAYQKDALAAVQSNYPVSFLSYMLHPITSLVGIRGYDKPLGAMLASEVTRSDVLTGPNPQLPVLLDYFFANSIATATLVAFLIGFLVVGIRPLGALLARSRSRYLRVGGIAAAVFCPGTGFLDTSLVLISLVGIVAVTAVAVTAELVFAKSPGDARDLAASVPKVGYP